jgi:DNA phosphorothioation-dependent restriction protein DptG
MKNMMGKAKSGGTSWVAAAAVIALIVVAVFGLSACGKALEPFNDAGVAGENNGKATVINMPDGFSNVATKCDNGNRVYVVYHGDNAYGSVAVVPNDPTCAK